MIHSLTRFAHVLLVLCVGGACRLLPLFQFILQRGSLRTALITLKLLQETNLMQKVRTRLLSVRSRFKSV